MEMISRRSYILFILGLFFIALTSPGYSQGTAQFESIYGGPWSDGARSIVALSDGGFALGGWKTQETEPDLKEGWIIRIDDRGRYQWDLPLPRTGQEGVLAMSPALDGGIFVISDTDDGPSSDTGLTKVSHSGIIEWSRTYGGRGRDRVSSIRPTPDGGLIMVGQTTTGTEGLGDGWIVKLDNRFEVQWFRALGGPQVDAFNDVAVAMDGSFIAVGFITDDSDYTRGWAVQLDPLGRSMWQETYALSDRTQLQSVYPLLTGNFVFVANVANGSGHLERAAIGSIDRQGAIEWSRKLRPKGMTQLYDLIQTSDGLMVAVGILEDENGRNGLTVAFTPSGSTDTLIRRDGAKQVQVFSITSTSFGAYAASGTSFDQERSNEDVWVSISREIVQQEATTQELEQ